MALVLLSSLFYAFYIIGVNQTHTGLSAIQFTFWVVLFGLISLLVLSVIMGEQIQVLTTPKQWACAAQLALLPTVLSLYFMNIAIEKVGSTPSAIMGAVEPVTAVFIGVLIFGESFSLRLFVGIVLILSAVILLVLSKKRRTSRATRSVLCGPSVADAFSPLVLSAAWVFVVCPALPYYCFRRLGYNAFRTV